MSAPFLGRVGLTTMMCQQIEPHPSAEPEPLSMHHWSLHASASYQISQRDDIHLLVSLPLFAVKWLWLVLLNFTFEPDSNSFRV